MAGGPRAIGGRTFIDRPSQDSVEESHSASIMTSFLTQYQVNDPATPDANFGLAAMSEYLVTVAASAFEGVGKFRHTIKRTIVVNGLGENRNVWCEPFRLEGERMKRIAKDVSKESGVSQTDFV